MRAAAHRAHSCGHLHAVAEVELVIDTAHGTEHFRNVLFLLGESHFGIVKQVSDCLLGKLSLFSYLVINSAAMAAWLPVTEGPAVQFTKF